MTTSNGGLTRCVALISADLDDGRAGTGTTLSTPDDTDLETPVADTEADVSVSATGNIFTVTHLVDSLSGNSSDLTEWQIRMNSEATQLQRCITAPVSKTDEEEVTKITHFTLLGE